MLEWSTASTVARGAKLAFDNRHLIQEYWVRALAKFDLGATDVVVTGHSGAGKSLLASQMHGRARDLYFEAPDESMRVEVEAVTIGDWTRLVRVLPGQAGRRTEGELEAFNNNDSLEGVIHVVDFGFVMPRDGTLRDTLVERDNIDTVEKLRAYNMRAELDGLNVLFNDIAKLRKQKKRPNWLVIAVNKVDLFQDQIKAALSYYHPEGTGEFGKRLREFWGSIGTTEFGVYVIPACAYEADFEWNGTKVASQLPKQGQNQILRDFMSTVAQITEVTR